MTKVEIARDLTLKMLELNRIHLDRESTTNNDKVPSKNEFNAKQVADFYNYILKNICN